MVVDLETPQEQWDTLPFEPDTQQILAYAREQPSPQEKNGQNVDSLSWLQERKPMNDKPKVSDRTQKTKHYMQARFREVEAAIDAAAEENAHAGVGGPKKGSQETHELARAQQNSSTPEADQLPQQKQATEVSRKVREQQNNSTPEAEQKQAEATEVSSKVREQQNKSAPEADQQPQQGQAEATEVSRNAREQQNNSTPEADQQLQQGQAEATEVSSKVREQQSNSTPEADQQPQQKQAEATEVPNKIGSDTNANQQASQAAEQSNLQGSPPTEPAQKDMSSKPTGKNQDEKCEVITRTNQLALQATKKGKRKAPVADKPEAKASGEEEKEQGKGKKRAGKPRASKKQKAAEAATQNPDSPNSFEELWSSPGEIEVFSQFLGPQWRQFLPEEPAARKKKAKGKGKKRPTRKLKKIKQLKASKCNPSAASSHNANPPQRKRKSNRAAEKAEVPETTEEPQNNKKKDKAQRSQKKQKAEKQQQDTAPSAKAAQSERATFARRYRPSNSTAQLKYDAIRTTYEKMLRPKLRRHSQMEARVRK